MTPKTATRTLASNLPSGEVGSLVEQGWGDARLGVVRQKVVVVLPAYNEAEALEPLLASLRHELASAGLYYEVLVVDDGSGDDTALIASRASFDMPGGVHFSRQEPRPRRCHSYGFDRGPQAMRAGRRDCDDGRRQHPSSRLGRSAGAVDSRGA